MELVREFYRRLMGNDGWKQIGGVVAAGVIVGTLILARELFGLTAIRLFLGGVVVFVAGAYLGIWMERRRISTMLGVEIKPDI